MSDGSVVEALTARVAALEARVDVAVAISAIVEGDPHQHGTRPCESCRTISSLLGRDFGCVAKAKAPR